MWGYLFSWSKNVPSLVRSRSISDDDDDDLIDAFENLEEVVESYCATLFDLQKVINFVHFVQSYSTLEIQSYTII